jgi:RHS repeat-associated protein
LHRQRHEPGWSCADRVRHRPRHGARSPRLRRGRGLRIALPAGDRDHCGDAILAGATFGGANPASPGISQNRALVADPVDPSTGDFTESNTDLSIPTYGPALDFARSYDAQLAEQQTKAGTPGQLGYGWTDNWASSLSMKSSAPGDIYTLDGLRTDNGDGGSATAAPLNSPGGLNPPHNTNTYIADTSGNRIQVVAGTSGTYWGVAMTAGDVYTIAGSATGVQGHSGDGGAALSALLNDPAGVALDSSGNLYIADSGNNRVQEIPVSSGTQWGIPMTANDIYTVAGSASGTAGKSGDGGASTASLLNDPYDVTPGFGTNDIYIADSGNNRIQEICATTACGTLGDIYTFAGSSSGTAGDSGDGHAANLALLNDPTGINCSAIGSLYIADYGNNRIQEVSADTNTHWGIAMSVGDIYTVAGSSSGTAGHSANGTVATSALLDGPIAVAVDNSDQLYIADALNNRVEEDANSTHTEWNIPMTAFDMYTVAGSNTGTSGSSGDGGLATSALLSFPDGVTMDAGLNLYVSDAVNNKVREVSASTWDISTYAGDGGGDLGNDGNGGPSDTAGVDNPDNVATDSEGNVYVADSDNNRVEEIAASSHTQWGISMTKGDVYTIAGFADGFAGWNGRGNIATNAELDDPTGLAIDKSGNLYITDTGNNRIEEVPAASGTQWSQTMTAYHLYTIAGSSTGASGDSGDSGIATSALLDSPFGVAVDAAGDVYVADWFNNQVREIAVTGGAQWGISSMTAAYIYTIAGSSTGASGDSGNGGRSTSALLDNPLGVDLDSAGNLYIADSINNRVQEVAKASGTQRGISMTANDVYTIAGSATASYGHAGDGGPATAALLGDPVGLAFDGSGDLYVADTGNNRIQEIASSNGTQWSQSMTAGYIYTVAGSSSGVAGYSGAGGPATSALLDFPFGVAVDPSGDLYIANELDNSVQEVTATATLPFSLYPTTPSSAVTVNQSTGAEITFYPQVGGSCTAPYVVAGGYCALPQDVATLTYNSGSNTYSFATDPNETDTYNSSGQLTAETDADGDTLTLTYGSPSPGSGECPSTASSCNTVTAAGGRAIVIGLNASAPALVTSVTDPLGRRWTYAYNSSDDLTSATDPMTRVTSYAYGNGTTGNPLLVNDLLTVTRPNAQSGGPDAGDDTVNVFNASGQVISQTDPMGFATTLNYANLDASTGNGTVNAADSDGNTLVYDYESGALAAQSAWTGAVGSTLVSEADDLPNLTISGSTGGTLLDAATTNGDVTSGGIPEVTSYTYDAAGNVTSTKDPLAETDSATFTSKETLDCATVAESASLCSSLSPPSTVAPGGTITPPSSAPPVGASYSLVDTDGNVLYSTTGVYEPGSGTASYSQTTYTLYKGNSVTLAGTNISCTSTPPSQSLPCATINPDKVVTQLAYDADGDLTSSSTPDGNGSEVAETTYFYNGDGEKTSTVAPDGNLSGANVDNFTTATAYDSDGEVTSTTEAGGTGGSGPTVTPRATYDYYDGDGNITSTKKPRGYTTTNTFNADDEQVLVTDPDSNQTLTCYDGDGNVTEIVPPVGVAANSLTPASCPTSYPTGYGDRLALDATTYSYDANGNDTVMTTPAPAGQTGYETTTYTYDPAGNMVEAVAPPTSNSGGAPTDDTFDTYNADGELSSDTIGYGTSAASTTSYCYDPNGDTTTTVAADGNISGVAACETSFPWVVNSTSYPSQAAYQTTSSYDSAGELASTTTPATSAAPSGITTSYTYDPQGNKLQTTDQVGVTTTDSYTPANLVASVSYSGSSAHSVSYTYDADGNKTAMSDATGSSSFVFDPFGELTSAENGASQTVVYGYDADSDTTGITYPLPATATWATTDTVGYAYDHADELTSVTDFDNNSISISNTSDDLPYSETLASSGDSVDTTYDQTDSPSVIDLKNGSTTLLGFSYSDAPSGAILAETDTPSSSKSPADYTYDAQSRVTSMTPGTGSPLDYGFDASGALTTIPTGATGSYNNAGELTSSILSGTTTSYNFDADGQRTTTVQGGLTIASGTWNGADELTSYSNSSADMSSATYDGDGLRASETSTPTGGSPSVQSFVWDAESSTPKLLVDSNAAYVFAGNGTPAEQVDLATGAVDYLVADSLGSVRGVATATGTLSASTDYDAWGNAETVGGLTSYTPFGFAGGYTDPSGLVYLLHRYYDPATGQFLNVDPLVSQTFVSYGYAADDPVDTTDPSGQNAQRPNKFCCGSGGIFTLDPYVLYTLHDGNGTETFIWYPHVGYVNWSFRLSVLWQLDACTGVSEGGLEYILGNGPYKKNAPHPPKPSDYHWHEAMTGVKAGIEILYEDYFGFGIPGGDGCDGTAIIRVFGHVQTK